MAGRGAGGGGKPRRDTGDPEKDLGGRRNERMWDLRREIYGRVATELDNTCSYIYRIKSVSVAGWAGAGAGFHQDESSHMCRSGGGGGDAAKVRRASESESGSLELWHWSGGP